MIQSFWSQHRRRVILSEYDLDNLQERIKEMKQRGYYQATQIKKTLNEYTGRIKHEVLMKEGDTTET